MSSDTYFNVQVEGCAAAAYRINDSRSCVMDVKGILLESEDNVRQIHLLKSVLGIRTRQPVPVPPSAPAPAVTRPFGSPTRTGRSGELDSDSGEMMPMEAVRPRGSALPEEVSLVAAPISATFASTSSRTFTPVSTMQRLAHAVRDDLPMDMVATNALDFVAAWRREDARCAAAEDLVHEALTARHTLEANEEASRWRLRHLLVGVAEQLGRFALLSEYDAFAAFCAQNEPVWRHAARQLQQENNARLNTTANIYTRFLFEDEVVGAKSRMFQEAADYVVSLHLAEREERSAAMSKAVARRRRQSVSEVATPMPTPKPTTTRRADDQGRARSVETQRQPAPRAADERGGATSRVQALSSVEVDNYKQGWRTMLSHLTQGEVGGTARQSSSLPPATAAAAASAAGAGGQGKQHGGHSKAASPTGVRDAGRSPAKEKPFAFPSPKDEKRKEAQRPSTADKHSRTSLPPITRDAKPSSGAAAASATPQLPKSKDEPRSHRPSSHERDAKKRDSRGDAAPSRAKAETKVKEAPAVAVKAAPAKRTEDKHHQQRTREAKVR